MELSKQELGNFLELLDNRNSQMKYGVEHVRGVNNLKQLMPTKADLSGRDLSKFQIVRPGEFVFNHRTSRNGSKFSIAYNDTKEAIICTEDYVVFRVKPECEQILSARWLYMFFNRAEFDRYVITNSWGSSTEFYNWQDVCEIVLDIPAIEVQMRYASIYEAMLKNQQSYEHGLEDLKLLCEAYIENLRRTHISEPIGQYIEIIGESNTDKEVKHVQGVESSGSFMDTRAKMQGVDISKYTIVREGNIAYNPSRINLGSIAIYRDKTPCIVSPMYSVFKVIDNSKVIPEYLMLWFGRSEFQRYTWFYASGSVRDSFDFNLMKEVQLPIPPIEIQQDIVNIYDAYMMRRDINERLKIQVKKMCPILIRGSVEESKV